MRRIIPYIIICILLAAPFPYASAQQAKPTLRLMLPDGIYPAYVDGADTIVLAWLPEIYVFPELVFKNEKERQAYNKLVRDVKRTLPYAKIVYHTLIETYEYIETLPTEKEREAHLKKMEKELFREYKPELKQLSLSQGKLLIKLIDRECNQSSYKIVTAYLGRTRAIFWNLFAGVFGASLKSKYDPRGKDALTERIILLVERGQL